MSSIDLQTGIVSGCKQGSWNWYHEEGHYVFYKQKPEYAYLREISIIFAVFAVCFCFALSYKYDNQWIFISPLIPCGIFFLLYLYEEAWCWNYAAKNKPTKDLTKQIKNIKT